MSIFILLLVLGLWGIVHSILASHFAKDMLRGILGRGPDRWYRLGYNLWAGISFLPILYLMRIMPDQSMYVIPPPWSSVFLGGQMLAAFLLLISLLQTDVLSFIGLQQLFEDEHAGTLVINRFYRLMRHPLYTFGLLFIWLTPHMTQNTFALYLGATIYVIIGAYFEERKLLRDFGQAYADYQRVTPMLVPGLMFGRKRSVREDGDRTQ